MLKRGVVEKFWRQPDVLAGHFPYVEIAAIPPLIFTHRMAYNCLGELLAQGDRDYWHILISQFDLSIPFLPIFILPYLFAWVYAPFILFYTIASKTYDYQLYRCFYLSVLVMTGVECILWGLFPASIAIRVPETILAESGWLGEVTSYVYGRATPWNVFPSAHISTAYVFMLLSKHFAPGGQRWIFIVLFFLISLSVLFIKNHYLVDIIGGVIVGHLAYRFVFIPLYKRQVLVQISSASVIGFFYLTLAATGLWYLAILKS